MRKQSFTSIALYYILFCFLSSCTSSCGSTPSSDSPSEVTTTNKTKTIPQNTQIPKVNVFLEISGGMAGFMPKGKPGVQPTEFQSNVASLLADINYNESINAKDFFYIREKEGDSELVKEEYKQVLNTVSGGISNPSLGTELPEMLEQIIKESAKTKAVSVVVSDFIYGPSDKTKFNVIPQLVQGALADVKKRNLVISIFGNKSAFYGSYHPAVKIPNEKIPLQGSTKIPYFIWVIGSQQDVLLFNKTVFNKTTAEQVHYGFDYSTTMFEALPAFNSVGTVYCSTSDSKGGCKSIILNAIKEEPVEFEIGVNLTDFPTTLQSSNYLKNNLTISGKGASATILGVTNATNQTKADGNLDKFSHFIRVRISQLTVDTGNLTLFLPEREPDWITNWSTTNDNDPIANPGKTFKLKEIFGGVGKLYNESNKNLPLISITFTKEQ